MDKNKKIITILMILTIVFTIMGGTFAYWSWRTTDAQKTNITFTLASDFSCAADGGGNITSNDVSLIPTVVSDKTTANYIKREVKVTPTINTEGKTVYMDLWLDIITLDSGLSNSVNFRYAFTTSSTSEGVVSIGNFNGKVANDKVNLLRSKGYTSSTTETYYLWIWLDAEETDSATMNQKFNMKLGGECTDAVSKEVYTANIYDSSADDLNSVYIGQPISSSITTYNTPDEAMNALKTTGDGTTSYPFFLKHTIADGSLWYATNSVQGLSSKPVSLFPSCIFETSSECNSKISDGYVCKENTFTQGVLESYVGFVVTAEMATANPGMVVGTYYLKGGDDGKAFLDNAKTIYDAFGGVGCYLDGTEGGNPYATTPSSGFSCEVSGLRAYANSNGTVGVCDDSNSYCNVDADGYSYCILNTKK